MDGKRRILGLLTGSLIAACATPESTLDDHREDVQRQLDALEAVAKRVQAAPPLEDGASLKTPPVPLKLCPVREGRGREDCNTVVVSAKTLVAPAKHRNLTNQGDIPREHSAFVVHAAQVLAYEAHLIHEERATPPSKEVAERKIPQTVKMLERWFEELSKPRFVVVIKPSAVQPRPEAPGERVFGADAFLYDRQEDEQLGGARIEARCVGGKLVYTHRAGSDLAGKSAGRAHCLTDEFWTKVGVVVDAAS